MSNDLNKIADAINNDSKNDRKFAYGIVSIVVGSAMWQLINTLAGNMESMSKDMSHMRVYMENMDNSMLSMHSDIKLWLEI